MLIMTINKIESDGEEACHCQSLKWMNVDAKIRKFCQLMEECKYVAICVRRFKENNRSV